MVSVLGGKKFDDMYSRIDTIPSSDGWTNRQTDGAIFNSLNNPYGASVLCM